MERRVAITGLGIVSCLGNSYETVAESLKAGRSGIRSYERWKELGLKSTVGGWIEIPDADTLKSFFGRRKVACMPNAALYCALAAKDAIEDAGLTEGDLRDEKTACIVGSGVGCVTTVYENGVRLYGGDIRRISPYTIIRCMSSSCSANLVNVFPVGGRSYSISSACATSTHNIGHAYELIRHGVIDRALAGGGEDVNELTTAAFCAMRLALSSHYNDTPEKASRPFDKDRDGFVISGGGGIVVLEALEVARARGATVYAEIVGYAANSDGFDITFPEPEGKKIAECMRRALEAAGVGPSEVDYINAHGTSTIAGDAAELKAIRDVFGSNPPPISSTKSMGGHAIGATGAHEVFHCVAMMREGFIAPSINVERLEPGYEDMPVVTETTEADLGTVMSNSFGFGGTNGVLVLQKA